MGLKRRKKNTVFKTSCLFLSFASFFQLQADWVIFFSSCHLLFSLLLQSWIPPELYSIFENPINIWSSVTRLHTAWMFSLIISLQLALWRFLLPTCSFWAHLMATWWQSSANKNPVSQKAAAYLLISAKETPNLQEKKASLCFKAFLFFFLRQKVNLIWKLPASSRTLRESNGLEKKADQKWQQSLKISHVIHFLYWWKEDI